jgi:formate/nitrite transporter FocA (FNT family)
MSAAVAFARQKNWLPLLFGIPLFILCGFYHSIADTFYYSFAVFDGSVGLSWELASWLALTYFGNLLGCRLHLLFKV